MGRPLEFDSEKKAAFLEALARCECIRAAAAEVGVLPGSVAWARGRDRAFRKRFDEVVEQVRDGQALVRLLAPPRIGERHDGFTAEKRRKFFKALRKTGCMADAAKIAGVSTTTVKKWRDKDEEFARSFAAARSRAGSDIGTLAWERGVTGIEEPVWYYGKKVGTRLKRSDAVFRMLMIASDPARFGWARRGGETPKEMEKRLRRKIMLERQAAAPQLRQNILRKLRAIEEHDREEGWRRLPGGGWIPPAGSR